MKYRALVIAGMTSAFAVSPALAQDCSPSALTVQQVGDDTYDPSDPLQQMIRVRITNTERCVPRAVEFTPAQSSQFRYRYRGERLPILPAETPSLINQTPSSLSVSSLGLRALSDGGSVEIDLFKISPGVFVPAGIYENEMWFHVDGARITTIASSVNVSPTVQLLGEAATGSVGLDLGQLQDGATGRYSIFTRSNGALSLNVRSENEARLIHDRGVRFGFIRYSARINGSEINLSSAREVSLGFAPGQLVETVLNIDVPVPDNAYAGTYRDVLTFSFTAD